MNKQYWFERFGLIPDTHSTWVNSPNGYNHTWYHVGLFLLFFTGFTVTFPLVHHWFIALIVHLCLVALWFLEEVWQAYKGNADGWYKTPWYRIDKYTRKRHQDWLLPALAPITIIFIELGKRISGGK